MAVDLDGTTREFYTLHIEGTRLVKFFDEELGPVGRASALAVLLRKPAFRRDPRRLDRLYETLVDYRGRVIERLDAFGVPPPDRPRLVHAVLQALVKYSGSLYTWQDNPDLMPVQRSMLVEENVLPAAMEVMAQDLKEPNFDHTVDGLEALVERFVEVPRAMAQLGRLKKTRGDLVLKWCRYNILPTTQAYCDRRGRRCLPAALVDALANIKVRAVMFNTLIDELADDVQEPRKFALFASIPFAEDGALGAVSRYRRATLLGEIEPEWREYLDLTISVWNSFVDRLRMTVGEKAFAKHARQLRRDYREIVSSMRTALLINRCEHTVEMVEGDFDEVLSHNMNMMAFETIDRMALERAAPDVSAALSAEPALYLVIRKINLLFQCNGHRGNTAATLEAEIDENCPANEVLGIVAKQPGGAEITQLYRHRRKALRVGDMEQYTALAEEIRRLVATTGAERLLFERWMETRHEIENLARSHPGVWRYLDVAAMLAGNDAFFALSLVFRGDI